ncbi:MAG: hypothetical protein ACFFCS_15175 [Candidatus Hodarchaeota archaeon]
MSIEVFKLKESGEYFKVDEINQDNLESFLKEEEVFLILSPDIRRLYIWKGKNAPVTKKFISSRVAQKIQRERVRNAGMQHKIVSIDQGDELDEFIDHFNIKDAMTEAQRIEEKKKKEEEEARKFEELMQKPDIIKEEHSPLEGAVQASGRIARFMQNSPAAQGFGPLVAQGAQGIRGMSDKEKQEILDTVLKNSIPGGFLREHLVMDEGLYVNVKKMGKVFDEDVEIETWDEFSGALKDGFMEINDRKIRFFIRENKIKAIEILKKDGNAMVKESEKAEIRETKEPEPIEEEKPPVSEKKVEKETSTGLTEEQKQSLKEMADSLVDKNKDGESKETEGSPSSAPWD